MLVYLLKLTIIWSLLLLTYELLFKSSARYSANRLFLLLGLLAGIILPLLPAPWQAEPLSIMQEAPAVFTRSASPESASLQTAAGTQASSTWTIESMPLIAYGIGVGLLLTLCIAEIVKILRNAIYGKYTTSNGHRIFESKRPHAPFSFMGWIFVADIAAFCGKELDFILAHEAAHNQRKHWIDVLMVQILCILFWFHPLVWRYRYLLKMQHEYEADAMAAGESEYEYGLFLLQQTLLKSAPSIAHSFHFSPIKNRITMLTKKSKANRWNYLAILPVVAVCTMAMRSDYGPERKTEGKNTTFKSNKFEWMQRPDKDVVMAVWDSDERYVSKQPQGPIIVRMNGDSVYANDDPSLIAAQYRAQNEQYYEALNKKFKEMINPVPDSINEVNIMNVVIDKQGRIVYYDLEYHCKSSGHNSIPYWDKKIDDVIATLPDWLPALKDGKPVASYQEFAGVIRINDNPIIFSASPVSKEEAEKMSKGKKKN